MEDKEYFLAIDKMLDLQSQAIEKMPKMLRPAMRLAYGKMRKETKVRLDQCGNK